MAKRFWAADCETDPFKYKRVPAPFIFGAYCPETDEYFECETAKEFVEFFYDKDVVVYAHNGGKFDWHFILPFLEANGLGEQPAAAMIIAGRWARFKIGQAEYRDSYNLFPIPLAAYKKDKFDYRLLEKKVRHKHMEKIRAYLRNDCVYLAELLSRFFETYGRQLTLAGASMKQWQKISGFKAADTPASLYKDMSPYYYGGRVECFRKGIFRKRFKVFDINSAYPRAMMEDHPYGENFKLGKTLPDKPNEIGRAFISLRARSTGAFPFREPDGGLSFPNDNSERIFDVTGWEYLAALETGTLKDAQIISVITFRETINFKPYVTHFFAEKNAAKMRDDTAGELFAKLMLNSLYGKYAANPEEYSDYIFVAPNKVEWWEENSEYKKVQFMHNVALMRQPLNEEKRHYYNVAVGASITGWVRAYLWRALQSVKTPLYCDTDSVACVKSDGLDIGAELGQWKFEGDFKTAAIAGKKLYAFEYLNPIIKKGEKTTHKIASKGVKLTAAQIEAIASGATVRYENQAPTFGIRKTDFIGRNVQMT